MADKTIIITGGNASLGYEAAKAIARSNQQWEIVIAVRDVEKGREAVARLSKETGYRNIRAMAIDLASLNSIRHFVDEFLHQNLPPLHAIICNAGVMTGNAPQFTVDGFELAFGVNHLGHFLLVNLLLPYLVAPARLVVVSGAHGKKTWLARLLKLPPPNYTNTYDLAYPQDGNTIPNIGRVRYATSKLSNLLFTYELARRLQSEGQQAITVNAFNPGVMPGTRLSRDLPPIQQFIGNHVLPLFQNRLPGFNSTERSGQALARLVTDPTLASTSGKYFQAGKETKSSEESYDRQKATELWQGSLALVGLTLGESHREPQESQPT